MTRRTLAAASSLPSLLPSFAPRCIECRCCCCCCRLLYKSYLKRHFLEFLFASTTSLLRLRRFRRLPAAAGPRRRLLIAGALVFLEAGGDAPVLLQGARKGRGDGHAYNEECCGTHGVHHSTCFSVGAFDNDWCLQRLPPLVHGPKVDVSSDRDTKFRRLRSLRNGIGHAPRYFCTSQGAPPRCSHRSHRRFHLRDTPPKYSQPLLTPSDAPSPPQPERRPSTSTVARASSPLPTTHNPPPKADTTFP